MTRAPVKGARGERGRPWDIHGADQVGLEMGFQIGGWAIMRLGAVVTVAMGLAACQPLGAGGQQGAAVDATTGSSTRLVERDVEAPDVFAVTDQGLWDGRPSLGGVWVAHPSAQDPERVIIRNEANGRFVIGALFRRERDNPGPALQVSSDAASALGLLAGAPATLNVTALRREEVAEGAQDAPAAIATGSVDYDSAVATSPLAAPPQAAPAAVATSAPPAPVVG